MTEQITTPEALDALPVGSVVLDRHGDSWQKVDDTPRRDEDGDLLPDAWSSASWLKDRTAREMFTGLPGAPNEYNCVGPLTLLHPLPDAPAPSAEDQEGLSTLDLTVTRALIASRGWIGRNLASALVDEVERLAARQPAPVDAETAEVIAERARAVELGYDEQRDDERGADALAVDARHYAARAIAQGNRSDLIKAAGLLLNAAASFRRLGQPVGLRHEWVAGEHAAALASEEDEPRD